MFAMDNPAFVLHAAQDARVQDTPVPQPEAGEALLRLAAAGVCGSDLHYFSHGGMGRFTVLEPLILGHEIAATVEAIGEGVENLQTGQLVAVNPARCCGTCKWCMQGRDNLCAHGFYLGSASKNPHMQGAFRLLFTVDAKQCITVSPDTDPLHLALAEPLAVAMHAIARARVEGKKVLVIGCGTIGLLTILAAREAAASSIAGADIRSEARQRSLQAGAAETYDAAGELPSSSWELIIEASGTSAGICLAIDACEPGGRIIQVGAPPKDMKLANATLLMFKEIEHCHSFRFAGDVFAKAAAALSGPKPIDVSALNSTTRPLLESPAALAEMISPHPPAPKMILVP